MKSEKKTTAENDTTSDNRFRNYATMVYPESAPSNWQQILEEECVPTFISPLHDLDINPTGEAKKPHYHVIIMFEGKKSTDQVKNIFDKIGGVGLKVVQSVRGYSRYLCHLDNPEKAQYKIDDVRSIGGADYGAMINLATDKYKAIDEMMDYIDDNNIISYRDLLRYCRKERRDWFRILCDSGTYVILEYLKSAQWTERNKVVIDKETGEII